MIDEIGFNLMPGQGTGRYRCTNFLIEFRANETNHFSMQKRRYFGEGFENHECGIEMLNPDSLDRGFWKCLIGVTKEIVNNNSTIGAIIDGSGGTEESTRYNIDADDVYGLHNTQVNILCKSNLPADYCWFRHPNGRKISVSEVAAATDDDQYRYFGSGIHLGDCGVSIMNASVDDSGSWSCHIGSIKAAGIESSYEISVRVSGKLMMRKCWNLLN